MMLIGVGPWLELHDIDPAVFNSSLGVDKKRGIGLGRLIRMASRGHHCYLEVV